RRANRQSAGRGTAGDRARRERARVGCYIRHERYLVVLANARTHNPWRWLRENTSAALHKTRVHGVRVPAFAGTTVGYRFAFSRHDTPEVCSFVRDPQERAQGRPGARCTRGLVCKLHIRKRTRAYRFSGGSPAFPAQWFYGLFRALPGDRLFCHRRQRDAKPHYQLDPTTPPSPLRPARRAHRPPPTLPRPPHLAPNVRDDGETPLLGARGWLG